ncbi:MAG: peptide ABC transporter substrate-binding protein [Anaerolineae bacterium]|nr:peptide ABC transporter substrate-binding protein [Anaerolineae bacterium]
MESNRLWTIVVIVLVACVATVCVAGVFGGGWWLYRQGSVEPTAKTPEPVVPSGPRGTTLNLIGSDPPTLDPHLSMDATSAAYIVEIFSGLVTLSPELEVVPDIAERWEVSEDGTVYTFYLRDDAKFHDGKPVTARDFKYSFERVCDPWTGSVVADLYLGDIVGANEKLYGFVDEVSGVEVVDDHTLQITIDAPKSYFLGKLTHSTAFVVDKDNVERGGYTWTDKPNGTGPFKLKEYRFGRQIVLEPNDLYYGEPKPSVEQVNFILAGGSAMTMYENGELETVPVGLNDIERVTDPTNPLNKELTIVSTMSTYYLGFNVNQPPFDDVKVRQAFNYALDKQRIMDVIYKKTVPAATGVVPPTMPDYHNEDLEVLSYDPDKALELIAESKYGDVADLPEITLYTTGAGGATSRLIEAVIGMYKENLGVDVAIQQTEWATFLSDISQEENPYQMYSIGWIADYPDPENFLDVLFHSEKSENHMGYSNPELDELLEKARTEQDPEERLKLYQEVEQIIINDAPWVPLFYEVEYWLTKPYVKGMIYPPMIIPKLQYVSIETD